MKKSLRVLVLFSLLFLVSCNSNNESIDDINSILKEAQTKISLPNIIDENIELPTEVIIDRKKVSITWKSSKENIIDEKGKYFVPEYSTEVKLTSYLTYQKQSLPKEFYVIANGNKDFTYIFNNVDKYITENTKITLLDKYNNYSINWLSNNTVLNLNNNELTVNKYLQKHQELTEELTAEIILPSGNKILLSEDIVIAPIKFNNITAGPIAVYHSVDFTNYYKQYSERYQTDKKLFSDTTKEILDIVYYAFAEIKEDATVYIPNLSDLSEVLKLRNHDVRVVICISGVSKQSSINFDKITSNDELRNKFVTNIMNLVDLYRFDGVDIDWESVSEAPVKKEGMNLLMRDLKTEMNQRQHEDGSAYILTCAVPASSWGAGVDRFDFKTLNNYVDYINLMSYSLNKNDITTHGSSLYSSENDKGFKFGADYGVNLISSRGFPKEKIIIGGAGYGKAFKVTETSTNESYPGLGLKGKLTRISGVSGSYDSGTLLGHGIKTLLNSDKYKLYHEYDNNNNFVGSYLYSEEEQIFVTFDSQLAAEEKYKYAIKNNTGMMFWCYGEDPDDIILNTIYNLKK